MTLRAPLFALLIAASVPAIAQAQAVEAISVWGRRANDLGRATSASEGRIAYADFAVRPLLRPGELIEAVPGLAATQHSGAGKANQYFLRGFNLDHGTDLSASLDGVPLNLPSHGHGQGYLDLNLLTPEFVHDIAFKKGPYSAENGDFATAGAVAFETADHLHGDSLQTWIGENDYYRAVGSKALSDNVLVAGDVSTARGAWSTPEDLKKLSLLGRALVGGWSVTALAYDADWTATDQIPRRAVEAGTLGRLDTIDKTDGGESSRYILSARRRDLMRGLDAVVYVQRYKLDLWSNFAYFLDDPANGDQFEQVDQRWIYGGSLTKRWAPVDGWSFRAGGSIRVDDIGKVGLYRTTARARRETVRQDALTEWSAALWGEGSRRFGKLDATFGLRADAMGANVEAGDPRNNGKVGDVLVSPKLTLAWRISRTFEAYADAGRGFHSNDARGAVIAVDPVTADPVERSPLLSPSDGAELGLRWKREGLIVTAAAWALHVDSELVYVGDAGFTEASSATRRAGLELLADWRPSAHLNLTASYAATHARFVGDPPQGDRIPNAVGSVLSAGASWKLGDESTVSLTWRRLGAAPLVEDNSMRSRATSLVNALFVQAFGRASLMVEVLNLTNSKGDDIAYFYASRLPGEPSKGVDDVHFHPVEPRAIRAGLKINF
ncbi:MULTISPECIES: TonB-dependent receptor [unclassified Caulobacter]|uniref:TonB-dependent receptor n=1 Tax=unclassified Caulobacter TaxID=2648921 RepID=UPI0006FC9741|nr:MULTISPECIES: TonB-dependent receptor [unclassified Caulobacter]KQV57807.1 TonB-dependent receptor [Caulobacter sp. Root342]KQV67379.1 TonB-dependent receptor [Caulobacter sp. Root343]